MLIMFHDFCPLIISAMPPRARSWRLGCHTPPPSYAHHCVDTMGYGPSINVKSDEVSQWAPLSFSWPPWAEYQFLYKKHLPVKYIRTVASRRKIRLFRENKYIWRPMAWKCGYSVWNMWNIRKPAKTIPKLMTILWSYHLKAGHIIPRHPSSLTSTFHGYINKEVRLWRRRWH